MEDHPCIGACPISHYLYEMQCSVKMVYCTCWALSAQVTGFSVESLLSDFSFKTIDARITLL